MSLFIGALSSCQASTDTANNAKIDENGGNNTPNMSVLDMIYCKPDNLAFIAAHRGRDKNTAYPENALESLQALYEKSVLFAEIDIARLKDGTLILAHDGVWERISNGKGPLANTTWTQSQKYLLKNAKGQITPYHPSKFTTVLEWAKYKMVLEIDFKSSVSERIVIDKIKSANMLNQVILISYSKKQALRLQSIAPEAAISIKVSKYGDFKAYQVSGLNLDTALGWIGKQKLDRSLSGKFTHNNIPILSSKDYRSYDKQTLLPDLIVTDYAISAQKDFQMNASDLARMRTCMNNR
ncbi:MAG: glycerophosphodiester phosphodiesterase family protein [Robiginitomaculum sp.]|nr:glycerophosphodiester phosphodiesterase family protein [Robiginitomaculum sp.]